MKRATSHHVALRGLVHHVLTWGDPAAPKLFLLHGWMDVAASFQFLVDAFAGDWYAIAPDLRGYGQSAWQAQGYWFPDYVADLEALLRKVIRAESGVTVAVPADKWRDGLLVLRPGKPGIQEKSWPIETFFHKVVMIRNRLRTLEQQVNAMDVPEDAKVKLQAYITACYGSLTSFNVLFAEEEDQFRGSGAE